MEWKEISSEEAKKRFEEFCNTNESNCPEEYKALRNDILNLFSPTLSEIGIDPEDIKKKGCNYAYQVDYVFGLKFYQLLNERYNMSIRTAATDGVWRFLSNCVVPDLVNMRYNASEHPDRFWKKPKRIWLRVIWWYIHLSWQGDEESTRDILKGNSTDEIAQLVDRCGNDGYRVDLYREMMRKYAEIDSDKKRTDEFFRRMMVLNTAKVQVIEPELVDGGEKQYIDDLCEYLGYKKEESE
ncbi:hypothetical protein [Ruminococcus flavefaciens]|uniref:hypothetical protein n=1 Tax=Ruminococcus flavefaciens TaxID=1265 RepID=UPI0003133822|nr:hypothetical protein [Ruminococcus flavefaciens]